MSGINLLQYIKEEASLKQKEITMIVSRLRAKETRLEEKFGGEWTFVGFGNHYNQGIELLINPSTKKGKLPRIFSNSKVTPTMEYYFGVVTEPKYVCKVGDFYQEVTEARAIELVGTDIIENYKSQFQYWQTKTEITTMLNKVKQDLIDSKKTYQGGENHRSIPVYTVDPSIKF